MVIEKNKINIFKGLIAFELVNCSYTVFIGANEKAISIIALNKAITQYKSILTLPILILGKNIIEAVIRTKVVIAMISVGIISKYQLCSFSLEKQFFEL